MHVLVTGGAGYIGSVTAAALLDAGHEVTVLDDLTSGHRELVPPDASFVSGDIAESGKHSDLLATVDACVHFAAAIAAGESMARPEAYLAINTAGTLRLLRALIEAGVTRFVLSSTAAVYGDPERVPIFEDDATVPVSVYGASKLMVEQALAWLTQLRDLRAVALRYFNAAGATGERGEDHNPETHLIPLVLEVAAGRRPAVSIYGTDYSTADGTCVRDYIHVVDLADAHVRALEALDRHRHLICNLGNGNGFSVREVIEAARRVTGHELPVIEQSRRAGDPAALVASSARARDLLGWRPQHPDLDDIVASAWRWHRRRWDTR